ncbi:MAG TPA: prepilin peptidase [Terriglobia bacterium]|nr:prepilin peptidase [Terriglobia bacterium]
MNDVFIALFGLALGSFLNVCIVRLPRRESIITPRSHCPRCDRPIAWYHNIPLASYLALRGRCAFCRQPISPVYPLVESLTAALFVLAFREFGPTLGFVKAAAFIMLLLVLIFTDLNDRRLPHAVTLPGIALGLFFSLVVQVNDQPFAWMLSRANITLAMPLSSLLGALGGALVGGGLFYIVGEAFYRIRHVEGLGFGDVMLMLMVGAFLGAPLTLLTILLGSLLGIVVALALYGTSPRFRGRYPWPYGSFLGAAAIYASLRGNELLAAYLRWSGLGP